MALIQSTASVALSAVNDNVLTGSQFEFAPYNCFVEFGLMGDANGNDLRIDVYSGMDTVAEALIPGIQNRMPIYPDEFVLNDVVRAGERLKVRVRNTSAAAARTIFFSVRLTKV